MLEKCIADCLACAGNFAAGCGRCANNNFSILDSFLTGDDFTGREPRQGYGIAIDIGTTTAAAALVDLTTAKIIARQCFMNPQRVYGHDVISRIHAANKGFLPELQKLITERTASCIDSLVKENFIQKIDEIVIAGNTTMIHLLLGQSCETLGVFPFKPKITLSERYFYQDLFDAGTDAETAANRMTGCPVKIIPWFSAYVGGDITAGLIYILQNITERQNRTSESINSFLLIDLGTNGELALYNKGKLIVTSCAAGPAFENSARGHAAGASGVVSGLARLLQNGTIDETGLLKSEAPEYFSQKEIRDLQLAVSAVRTGVEILFDTACMTHNDIGAVYLAGGIGQAVNVNDAALIGLIPQALVCKTQAAGNSSLGGAVRTLLSPKSALNEMQTLLADFSEINLAEHPRFNDMFAENMLFKTQ